MRPSHAHPRIQQRLSRRQELWVYGSGGAGAVTGIGPHPLEV